MTDWKPIASFDQADAVFVDVWVDIPPAPENYMVGREYRITDAYRREGIWYSNPCGKESKITETITHWMPLPEAPKKEG
jgi:hypothetical protein